MIRVLGDIGERIEKKSVLSRILMFGLARKFSNNLKYPFGGAPYISHHFECYQFILSHVRIIFVLVEKSSKLRLYWIYHKRCYMWKRKAYGRVFERILIRETGLEPVRLAALEPKSNASASSATLAC